MEDFDFKESESLIEPKIFRPSSCLTLRFRVYFWEEMKGKKCNYKEFLFYSVLRKEKEENGGTLRGNYV